MRISDSVFEEHQGWLVKVVKKMPDEVLRLYLVYNDHFMGPDKAREIWDQVVGEDFSAANESAILGNDEIKAGIQQGVQHIAGICPDKVTHHWWIECYVDSHELWDVIK